MQPENATCEPSFLQAVMVFAGVSFTIGAIFLACANGMAVRHSPAFPCFACSILEGALFLFLSSSQDLSPITPSLPARDIFCATLNQACATSREL